MVKGSKKDWQAKGEKKKEEDRKVVSRTRQGFGELKIKSVDCKVESKLYQIREGPYL